MDRPDPNPPRSPASGLLPLVLVAFVGGGVLLFLILVSGGFFVYVAAAVPGVALIGIMHYLLWGHQLEQEVAVEREIELAKLRAEEDFVKDKVRPRRF